MKSRKSVGDRTEPFKPINTIVNIFKGRTVTIYNSSYRTTGKEIREKITEGRIDTERGEFGNQSFWPDSIEGFRYV